MINQTITSILGQDWKIRTIINQTLSNGPEDWFVVIHRTENAFRFKSARGPDIETALTTALSAQEREAWSRDRSEYDPDEGTCIDPNRKPLGSLLGLAPREPFKRRF